MMKVCRFLLSTIALVMLTASTARADLASIAADLGATLNPGLAPAGVIFGTVTGGYESSGYQTSPFGGGYEYAMPSGMGSAAGDGRDFHWIHETSTFNAPATGTKWTFGQSSVEFILDPSIDHGPVPEEALEATLWGSADGGTTWVKGTIVEIYALGWHAGSIEDQPSSRWVFPYAVSDISLTQGLAQGSYYYMDGDAEIDSVTIIPAPGAFLLGAMGLGLVGWLKRRFA